MCNWYLQLLNKNTQHTAFLTIGEYFSFQLTLCNNSVADSMQVHIVLGIYNELKEGVFRLQSQRLHIGFVKSVVVCNVLDKLPLKPGMYTINVAVYSDPGLQDHIADFTTFEVAEVDYNQYGIQPSELPLTKILLKNRWIVR